MINTIILGHALTELTKLPSELVNCCVCSPPYWGLRDYGIEPVIWDGDKDCEHDWGDECLGDTRGCSFKEWVHNDKTITKHIKVSQGQFCQLCNAWRGSLGLEPTFELYIKHLCDIFDEVKRVLRKDGTCWINLGDSYGGSGNASGHTKDTKNLGYKTSEVGATKGHTLGLTPKSLCLIPQRFAIEMVNRGWICRNTIIWHKLNCMPSSAKDRFTVDFEYVYFFVKSKKYWFEQQFEAWTDTNINDTKRAGKYIKYGGKHKDSEDNKGVVVGNPEQGRNKRAVWTVPTQPFPKAHFAVYPETLIEPMIKAGCPESICKKCGKARVKIYKSKIDLSGKNFNERQKKIEANIKSGGEKFKRDYLNDPEYRKRLKNKEIEIIEADCGCNAGWESGINLDPFMGAGTTALVALTQRKRFIGIEIKQEYIDMSYKRIAQVQQRIF